MLFFTAGTVEEAAEAQPELDPLDALLAGLGTAGEDACGRTALHRAATEGDVDLIQALLVQADNPEGVQELVQAGDRDGQTPLHAAARCGQEGAVEALAAPPGRADVNAPDDAGWMPLHHAAASGSGTGALRALVRHGARLNAAAEGGWTPLHAAARHRNTAAVKALVEAGAQVRRMGCCCVPTACLLCIWHVLLERSLRASLPKRPCRWTWWMSLGRAPCTQPLPPGAPMWWRPCWRREQTPRCALAAARRPRALALWSWLRRCWRSRPSHGGDPLWRPGCVPRCCAGRRCAGGEAHKQPCVHQQCTHCLGACCVMPFR